MVNLFTHLVGMDGKEMMIQRFRGENPQWS